MADLSLKIIEKTDFYEIYKKYITNHEITEKEFVKILACAICFINAKNKNVQKLGYRIILHYSLKNKNYKPLYEYAINNGLYPISNFIEKYFLDDTKRNFFTLLNQAIMDNFSVGNITLTNEQGKLKKEYQDNQHNLFSVVAPTSFGKSDLILENIRFFSNKRICIITPSKALLAQTKRRIIDANIGSLKIITHPEVFSDALSSCVAILTQERLLSVLQKYPHAVFECVIVDEAHEILKDDNRAFLLAMDLIILKKRNNNVAIKFLSPFLVNSNNLQLKYGEFLIKEFKVTENIKSEKFFYVDIINNTFELYDQFFDDKFTLEYDDSWVDDYQFIISNSANKNHIYANRPIEVQQIAYELAQNLSEINSEPLEISIENIKNYVHKDYRLLYCLKHGVIYHHGSMPEVVRGYIEKLYKEDDQIKYIVSNSTLLSGVNLPIEKMFLMNVEIGNRLLTHSLFCNLIGRVARFSDIFSHKNKFNLLLPHIYIVKGKFFKQGKDILSKVASISKKEKDEVKNVLLEYTTEKNKEKVQKSEELLENFEENIIPDYKHNRVSTLIGKLCIQFNVTEIDVFACEEQMKEKIENLKNKDFIPISSSDGLMKLFEILFVPYLEDSELGKALKHERARNFYSMLINWRIENITFSEMVGRKLIYWKKCYQDNRELKLYVGKWGDIPNDFGNSKHYILYNSKSPEEIANIAIVRVKEELDFLEYNLTKLIEVCNGLELLSREFYNQFKYGSSDEEILCLMKNGASSYLAKLLKEKYYPYIELDLENNSVTLNPELVSAMTENKENKLLIFEVSYFI